MDRITPQDSTFPKIKGIPDSIPAGTALVRNDLDLLKAATTRYCHDHRYRAGRVAGAVRVDLDGAPAGVCGDDGPPMRD